jgi:hypothetical protein
MDRRSRPTLRFLVLVGALFAWLSWFSDAPGAVAQEPEGAAKALLVISSADASSAPTIVLRAYAMDGQGNPLTLDESTVVVSHDGQQVNDVEAIGSYEAGTFTIFLVDIPPGVAGELPAIQEAMEQYASPPQMEERIDHVAIYRVEESQSGQLLAPTNFFNTIRNFFAEPLETQSGPTALIDSLVLLLDDVESLKPKGDMMASIVVMSDGTDVVSTQFSAEDVGVRAAELGIPIHTIWVENENLGSFGQDAGREYLARIARESRGVAARLDQATEVEAIWDRIAAFRAHPVIHFRPETLTGGQHDVTLGLRDDPDVQAATVVSVSAAAPSVVLNVPPESRELVLEDLETPVSLSFSTTVTWLDDAERQLESAELLVNGTAVHEIDARDVDRFSAEISTFNFGPNTVQVAVVDELGQQATSPAIVFNVSQGETQVPEQMQSSPFLESPLLRLVGACVVLLLFILLLGLLAIAVRRWRAARRSDPRQPPSGDQTWERRHRGRPAGTQDNFEGYTYDSPEAAAQKVASGIEPAYLEVLISVTRMPPMIALTMKEHRIGRSPAQADIAFENDITVSRLHATIVLEGNDYRIYDSGSTSGTWVNGQPVSEYGYQLMNGDEIALGDALLVYRR